MDETIDVEPVLASGYSGCSLKYEDPSPAGSWSNRSRGSSELSIGDEDSKTVVVVGLAMVRSSCVKFRYLAISSSYCGCEAVDIRSTSSAGSGLIVGSVALTKDMH